MYKNRNTGIRSVYHRFMPDGIVITLPIDTFPVSDRSLFNSSGWPMSSLGLLDRFSRAHVDEDVLRKIASRCEQLSVNDSDKSLTDDQRLMLLRPSWCQTATEFKDYTLRISEIRSQIRNNDSNLTSSVPVENGSDSAVSDSSVSD